MKSIASILGLIIWVSGFVIAKGFWSTVFCIIPLWSYYIVVEHFLTKYSLI